MLCADSGAFASEALLGREAGQNVGHDLDNRLLGIFLQLLGDSLGSLSLPNRLMSGYIININSK